TLGTGALVDGSSYAITVETIDNATNANTNTSAATATFVYDTSAPTASVTAPANNTHSNSSGWAGSLTGSASDATSSVATVKLSIQKDGGASSCWDGTNAAGHFTSACPNYVTATSTTSWSATLGTGALVDGSSYAITVETIDNATNANTNTSAATATYVYDTTAPNTAALTTNGNY